MSYALHSWHAAVLRGQQHSANRCMLNILVHRAGRTTGLCELSHQGTCGASCLSNRVLKPVAAHAESPLWLQFEESLQREVKQAHDMKGAFLEQFSQEDFNAIVSGWNDKLKRVADGEQRWGLFQAMKP